MSVIEEVFAALPLSERRIWLRAARVAQDEDSTHTEHQLALDVTALLTRMVRVRQAVARPLQLIESNEVREALETTPEGGRDA